MNLYKKISISSLVLLCMLGCGKKTDESKSATRSGSKEIVFWHWWTDRQPIFEELAKSYQRQTGTKVRFQVAAPVGSDYNSKLQAAAQANTLPDIIGIAAGGEFLARYIKAKKIYELTGHMDPEWKSQFFPRALSDFTYKPGNQYKVKGPSIWAVPISAMAIQIFYNKDLFRKAGLDPEKPPTTWREFLIAGKKLRAKKIIPLSIGFGDLWMIGAFLEPYAWSYVGKKKMKETLQGKVPYSAPEWRKALNLFHDMKIHDILVNGAITSPNKESERLFASNRCAMIMNGSWGVNVFNSMNPRLNYGVMRLPVPEDASHPMYVRGGVGSGAAVTTNSKNPQEAAKFLRWLTLKDQQALYANKGKDMPANQKCLDQLTPALRTFASSMNNLIPDIGVSEKYEVQEVLWKGIQSIFIEEATPKSVLEDVDKAKRKVLKSL